MVTPCSILAPSDPRFPWIAHRYLVPIHYTFIQLEEPPRWTTHKRTSCTYQANNTCRTTKNGIPTRSEQTTHIKQTTLITRFRPKNTSNEIWNVIKAPRCHCLKIGKRGWGRDGDWGSSGRWCNRDEINDCGGGGGGAAPLPEAKEDGGGAGPNDGKSFCDSRAAACAG